MKLSDEKIAEARRLRDAGLTLREIAARVGSSHVTIGKHLARVADEAPPVERAPIEPPVAPSPDSIPLPDTLEFLRGSMRQSYEVAREARAIGNLSAAQRASRDVAMLSAVVARLEKQAHEDSNAVRYSRAEIEAATEAVRAKVEAYLARPLLCADCGRQLSADWGGASLEPQS